MAKKIDLSKLDPKKQEELRRLLAEAGSASILYGDAPLADPDYRKKCSELKSKFEREATKEGVSLSDVITMITTKIYVNSNTNEVYTKGKKPKWLEGNEAKYLVEA